jgi:hypothetical protein
VEADQERDPQQREWDRPAPGSPGPVAAEISRRVSSILDVVEREAAALRQEAREEAQRYMEYARRRADGLLAERQREIGELSGAIMERADRVLRQLDQAEPVRAAFEDLVRSLGEAAERLARETGDGAAFVAPAFDETPPAPPARTTAAHPPPHVAPAVSTPPPAGREPDTHSPEPTHPPSWPSAPQPPFTPRPPAAPPTPPTADGGFAERSWQDLNGARVVAIRMAAAGSTRGQVEGHIRDALGVDDPQAVLDEVFGAGSPGDARVRWARPAAG